MTSEKKPSSTVSTTAALRSPAGPQVTARAKASHSSRPREPVQYRYQLAQWVAERRPDGWYIGKSWSSALGEKPKWEGPYPFPEDVAIAIARYQCAELSNRHMSKARFYQVKPGTPLYGLPPLPDLTPSRKNGGRP